jgi:hypothetical protein
MLIDPSVNTSYIEDCEICCNPIQISVAFDQGELQSFQAESIEQ